MGGLRFGVDGDGNYGYYGADGSLIPFKNVKTHIFTLTFNARLQTKTYNISSYFQKFQNMTVDNFYIRINSMGVDEANASSGNRYTHLDIPKVSDYNAKTGVVSVNNGRIGHSYDNYGQNVNYATSITVLAFS